MALAAIAVVTGFYLRARMEMRGAFKNLPGKLGIEIQQTSEGFSLSKSEGGRTLFTIHASKATQFKEGGRAELHDVNILVYGRNSDRFDQIYGDDFEYDQQAGTVTAKGQVYIDLQGNPQGQSVADQAPPGVTPEPIHLRTQGMIFDQRSGLAETEGRVDFGVPEATGTAQGATYDSKKNELTLHAAIDIQTAGAEPTHIQAVHGTITKEPHVVILESAQLEGRERKVLADHAVVDLAADNSIQEIHATGNVRLSEAGGLRLRSPAAEMKVGAENMVESALFTGGVDFESETQGASGHSGEMLLHFVRAAAKNGDGSRKQGAVERIAQSVTQSAAHSASQSASQSTTPPNQKKVERGTLADASATRSSRPGSSRPGSSTPGSRPGAGQGKGSGSTALLKTIYASRGVTLQQAPRAASQNPQALAMTSSAMTFVVSQGRLLNSAQTEAAGQLIMSAAGAKNAGEQTVIDAQHFSAEFGEENRLRTAHGVGAVRVTSHTPGLPDKVSTSDTMVAQFTPGGEVSRVIQEGNFRYREPASSKSELGGRTSFAERATYSPPEDALTLQGSPRIVDGGMTVTADSIRLLRAHRRGFCAGQRQDHLQRAEAAAQRGAAGDGRSDSRHRAGDECAAILRAGALHRRGATVAGIQHRGGADHRLRPEDAHPRGTGRPQASGQQRVSPSGRQGQGFDHAGDARRS